MNQRHILGCIVLLLLSACSPAPSTTPTPQPTHESTPSPIPATKTPTPTDLPTETPSYDETFRATVEALDFPAEISDLSPYLVMNRVAPAEDAVISLSSEEMQYRNIAVALDVESLWRPGDTFEVWENIILYVDAVAVWQSPRQLVGFDWEPDEYGNYAIETVMISWSNVITEPKVYNARVVVWISDYEFFEYAWSFEVVP